MIRLGSLLLFLILFGPAEAQVDTLSLIEDDSILISATRLETRQLTLPQSSTFVNVSNSLPYTSHRHLGDQLYQVPGVFAQNGQNYAQDLRISLRGFGSRAAFGIRGVKIIVDGVPETTPDGQGQLDNIAVADLSSIQVLQGSSGGRYGNAAGGVLYLSTADPVDTGIIGAVRIGSFGYQQYRLSSHQDMGKLGLTVSGTHIRSDGYRDHSKLEQTNLQVKLKKQTDKDNLSWIFSYMDSPLAQDPGGVTLDQALDAPRSARDRNVTFDAGESIRHWKTSLNYERKLQSKLSLHALGFISGRDFDGKLPFANGGAIDLDRLYGGGTLELQHKHIGNAITSSATVGLDVGVQSDDRIRFVNQEGTLGEETLDQEERFSNRAIYFLHHITASDWIFDYSLRYDDNLVKVNDRFLSDEDDSGSTNLSAGSYGLGISRLLTDKDAVYIQHSTSFETPTLSELSADPDNRGGFNEDLQPSRAKTYEIGWKHKSSDDLSITTALYHINTKDELLPFELDAFPGRTFFMNAGETKRYGLELTGNYRLSKRLKLSSSYTYADYSFGSSSVGGADLDGVRLPGIPKHILDLGIIHSTVSWYGRMNFRHQGSTSVRNDDTISVDPFSYVELYLGHSLSIGSQSLKVNLSIHNLFDTAYFDNIRLNAFGGRYFEAAAGRNIQLGLAFSL